MSRQQRVIKMSTAIPTSTSITESAVIPAHLSHVWHFIKLQDFHAFWSKLKGSEFVKGMSPETDVVKWEFKDGTMLDVKQEEHSVCLLSPSHACPSSSWYQAHYYVYIHSQLTTTSPTLSLHPRPPSPTPPSSLPSAATRSHLVPPWVRHSLHGVAISPLMLMPVCLLDLSFIQFERCQTTC